ncbi:MAG: TIGR03086 family metal-binding protein [Acidimicrobiales bacterium]
MSTKPFEAAIATTRSVLANVTPDQLDQATPCASWKVRDVINHVIAAQCFFAAGIKGEPPTGEQDVASGDFLAAYDAATADALGALSGDGVMETTYKLPFGEMPGAAIAGLAATDTFTHGWDVAKATGQSTDLAPELAAGLLAASKQMIQPGFRGEDGKAPFGPEQSAPDGAPTADRLAAFLGRSV